MNKKTRIPAKKGLKLHNISGNTKLSKVILEEMPLLRELVNQHPNLNFIIKYKKHLLNTDSTTKLQIREKGLTGFFRPKFEGERIGKESVVRIFKHLLFKRESYYGHLAYKKKLKAKINTEVSKK